MGRLVIVNDPVPDYAKRAKRTVPSRFVIKRPLKQRVTEPRNAFGKQKIEAKLIRYDLPFADWDNAWPDIKYDI